MNINDMQLAFDPAKTILAVILLHIYSDFNFQIGSRLHEFKERNWWVRTINGCIRRKADRVSALLKYGRDYVVGLVLHSVSWSIITFAPLIVSPFVSGSDAVDIVAANSVIHAVIDHCKCNRLLINLWQDQLLHFLQIGVTLAAYFATTAP